MTGPSYRVDTIEGRPLIVCLLCDAISYHPVDVANLYCGRCHLFHEAVAAGRRLVAEGGTHECEEWRTFRGRCALCDCLLTRAGQFLGVTATGRYLELGAEEVGGRAPARVICRRVADYAQGRAPAGAALGACASCGAAIAFNPAKFPDQPHVCLQCSGIEPLPIDPAARP